MNRATGSGESPSNVDGCSMRILLEKFTMNPGNPRAHHISTHVLERNGFPPPYGHASSALAVPVQWEVTK